MKMKGFVKLGLCASMLLAFEVTHATEGLDELVANPAKQISLPQINLDNFDVAVMKDVLLNYGTFELVGPSADSLRELRQRALDKSKIVLNLPIEVLQTVTHKKDSLETIFKDFKI
jgi:hypothetical protein